MDVGRGIEVLVDAGEAQVGDLVERAQPVEDGEADLGAAHLRTLEPHRIFDRDRDLLDLRRLDAAPLRGRRDAGDDLAPIEGFMPPVGLDDDQRYLVHPLERGEPVGAGEALATPANR